jgi:rubrerythrin
MKPTDVGTNRTGVSARPGEAKKTLEGAIAGTPDELLDFEPAEATNARIQWSNAASPIGTMPPPGTFKGAAKAAIKTLKGEHPHVFLDQLGARLAFERTGTRLYEALLIKHAAAHVHEGGPTREELEEIRDDELAHFMMLQECMEELGADPTAVTPCANVQAVASHGVLQVVADPRTTLTQALDAVLVAELADNDAWLLLSELAEGLGLEEMAAKFQQALEDEEEHLASVRRWISAALYGQSGILPTPPDEKRERRSSEAPRGHR